MGFKFGTRIAAAAALTFALAGGAVAEELQKLPFTLNWKISGSHAPIFLAVDNGYFAEEGLDPEIVAGDGSANVVNRLASRTWEIGIGDIASVIKFNILNPDDKKLAIYNQTLADLAVVTMADRGIATPADLKGKVIGAPVGDTAFKMWPAFLAATALEEGDVSFEHMAPNIREAMLMQGKVDAITANEGTAYFNMKGAGVPDEDMVFLRYSENGIALVNIGLMVNEDFAKENPETVQSVVNALNKGYRSAMADPEAALDALLKRDPLLDRDIERERLGYTVRRMTTQPDVTANGLGFYSDATIQQSIDIVTAAEGLPNDITPADIIDMSFLPSAEERTVPATDTN